MNKFLKRILLLSVIGLSVTAGAFAFGSREVPQVQVENPSPWYLSPTGTSPTAKHSASVTFSVKMAMKSKSGYIPEYSINIENPSGTVIKNIVEKQKPTLGFFARLFTPRKQFTIKKTITWDGKNNSGSVVSDGRYPARLTVYSPGGTKKETDLGTFVVDTQRPSVTIKAPDGLVFNPTGSGKKTSLRIEQTNGTVEQLWTGTFYNSSGQAVRTYTWHNSAPKSFSWNGRNNSGQVLPNGHYTYRISSTDRAGNQSPKYEISGIVINKQKTPISLTLTNPYFSPNGDGVKDTTTAELSTSAKVPVTSWKLSLSNNTGTVVRSTSGQGQFPSSVVFNGTGSSGAVLPNGTYTVTFDVTFQNGNEGQTTAPLVLSTMKPPLAISYSNPAFSPNGDGIKDTTTATLSLKSSQPVTKWSVSVLNSSGSQIRTESGTGTPPSQVIFDGKGPSGNVLPDGTYTGVYAVTLADGMSNRVEKQVVIDTVPPKVTLSASTPVFMPNGSGSDNTEVITYTSNEPVTWTGELVNNQNQVLLKTQQPRSVKRVVLNNSIPTVQNAPAGLYVLNLTFEDAAGNTFSPPPVDISLFTHPIKTAISVNKPGFSPLAPSGQNTITATMSNDTPAGVDGYTVSLINNATGNTVGKVDQKGALQNQFTWNGTIPGAGAGNYPPDGTYRFGLTVHYTNGLSSSGQSKPFVLDITPPQISATPTKTGPFIVAADGKSIHGTAAGSVAISDTGKSITSWTARLLSPSGNTVTGLNGSGATKREISVTGTLPLTGPTPTAISVLPYQIQITATDQYGNKASSTVSLPLHIVGRVEKGRIHLLVPHLLFGPYKYALDSKSAAQGKVNEQTLSQVAQVLKTYPNYRVEVDGYSMEIYQPSSRYYNAEENIIVPLSKNRADIAKTALEQLGISASRIFARYWGGRDTLVNPHNVDLRWKNRRTVFILLPPGTPPATEPAALVKRFQTATGAK